MLTFPDDTQVAVMGLKDVFSDLYSEGVQPGDDMVEEIIKRLEEKKNYIPFSERAHRDYSYVLLREYRKYFREQCEKSK